MGIESDQPGLIPGTHLIDIGLCSGFGVVQRLLGLRHLLPIYPFLYVLAGGLVLELDRWRRTPRIVALLVMVGAQAAEAMNELFASFGLAMLTGVLCIYIVLVLLFKDFMQPATILGALVLSIPGAFLALFLTRTALSSRGDIQVDTRTNTIIIRAPGVSV